MNEQPGRLIASGRSASVYDLGDGRVLRRRRRGDIPVAEVAALRAAVDHGFPAPAVHVVDGCDLVLDRVDGEDMLTILGRRPWLAVRFARILADLHLRLREIEPPPGLSVPESADVLVHGDLHPGNVLMTLDGPVVIDWEGAGAGPVDLDAATTWLLLKAGEADGIPPYLRPFAGAIRALMRFVFIRRVGRPAPAVVDIAVADRLGDPNMRSGERERIRAFARKHGTGAA